MTAQTTFALPRGLNPWTCNKNQEGGGGIWVLMQFFSARTKKRGSISFSTFYLSYNYKASNMQSASLPGKTEITYLSMFLTDIKAPLQRTTALFCHAKQKHKDRQSVPYQSLNWRGKLSPRGKLSQSSNPTLTWSCNEKPLQQYRPYLSPLLSLLQFLCLSLRVQMAALLTPPHFHRIPIYIGHLQI